MRRKRKKEEDERGEGEEESTRAERVFDCLVKLQLVHKQMSVLICVDTFVTSPMAQIYRGVHCKISALCRSVLIIL